MGPANRPGPWVLAWVRLRCVALASDVRGELRCVLLVLLGRGGCTHMRFSDSIAWDTIYDSRYGVPRAGGGRGGARSAPAEGTEPNNFKLDKSQLPSHV